MGFAYVAPIGMQNLFVINAALTKTCSQAFATAIIVIFFDITLVLACFWWMGTIMQRHVLLQRLILLAGSLVVLYIGQGLLRAGAVEIERGSCPVSLVKTVSFACVVTWFNPQAVLDGTMMLGAFHAMLADDGALPFISGVMTASVLWFLSLTAAVSLFSAGFSPKILRIINVVSGLVIMGYGCRLFLTGIMQLTGL